MSEMNEYTPELYELEDEYGNKRDFEMVDAMEVDGQQYFAMIPSYDGESDIEAILQDDAGLVILKTDEKNGEEFLVSILDDDEYIRISKIFMKRLDEKYEEDEDEEEE